MLKTRFVSEFYFADTQENKNALSATEWLSTELRKVYVNGKTNPPLDIHVVKVTDILNRDIGIDSALTSFSGTFVDFDEPGTRGQFAVYEIGYSGEQEEVAIVTELLTINTNDQSEQSVTGGGDNGFSSILINLLASQRKDTSKELFCIYTAPGDLYSSYENYYVQGSLGTKITLRMEQVG